MPMTASYLVWLLWQRELCSELSKQLEQIDGGVWIELVGENLADYSKEIDKALAKEASKLVKYNNIKRI